MLITNDGKKSLNLHQSYCFVVISENLYKVYTYRIFLFQINLKNIDLLMHKLANYKNKYTCYKFNNLNIPLTNFNSAKLSLIEDTKYKKNCIYLDLSLNNNNNNKIHYCNKTKLFTTV